MTKEYYMQQALLEAKKAEKKKEVPVGCVIVYKDKIIARGHNLREKHQQASSHAEMLTIKKACKKIKSWRLEECDIYITLEPCPMCAGAILQARMRKIYFGAYEKKFGACGSVFNLFDNAFNHTVEIEGGLLEEQCRRLLQSFFKKLRQKKGA